MNQVVSIQEELFCNSSRSKDHGFCCCLMKGKIQKKNLQFFLVKKTKQFFSCFDGQKKLLASKNRAVYIQTWSQFYQHFAHSFLYESFARSFFVVTFQVCTYIVAQKLLLNVGEIEIWSIINTSPINGLDSILVKLRHHNIKSHQFVLGQSL